MSGAAGARRSTVDGRAPPSLAAATLKGLCPRCGAASLFAGLARFAPECRACGLDFAAIDVGDGPAAFLILIVGAIVAVGAILVDLAYSPRWWVHLLWLPVMVVLTLAGLRFGKAALLYQIYHHRAGEGRLSQMIRRWPLIPTILVAAAVATMIGLGIWQLQRRAGEARAARPPRRRAGPAADRLADRAVGGAAAVVPRRDRPLPLRRPASAPPPAATARANPGFLVIADCRVGAEGPGMAVELGWSKNPSARARLQGRARSAA